MTIKKGDFVRLEFTGKVSETDKVFDTNNAEEAKKAGIYQDNMNYKPITIVVGEGHLIPGLDDELVGKKTGKLDVKIGHEKAFGKKTPQLLKIVPTKEFSKQKIKPFVGLEVNIDGMPGVVRTVSGGRTIVDFNHPLAGKDLDYSLDVKKILTDDKEKVEAILDLMGVPQKELKLEGKKAAVSLGQKIPDQFKDQAEEEVERLTGVKIEFSE